MNHINVGRNFFSVGEEGVVSKVVEKMVRSLENNFNIIWFSRAMYAWQSRMDSSVETKCTQSCVCTPGFARTLWES